MVLTSSEGLWLMARFYGFMESVGASAICLGAYSHALWVHVAALGVYGIGRGLCHPFMGV